MTSGHIEYQRGDDRIAILTITQPERRNAVTYPMMEQFFDLLRQASDDEECRVIIITGAGDTFCSGTDVTYLSQIPPEKRGFPGSLHDEAGWWNITACPKPVIAAIDGYAVGMGAEWASMCDVRIGTTRCSFSWNFVHRGLVPDTGAGTWLLPRLIGVQPALRLLLAGDTLDAEAAHALGFLTRLVEPGELMSASRQEAERYLTSAPGAVAATKRLVYDGMHHDALTHQQRSRRVLLERFASQEHARGIAGFLDQGRER